MDGRWLTYAELAGELGTSAEGARRRAQRGRWTRQRGNDGLARVLVPEDALDGQRPVRAPSVRSDSAGASSESLSLIEALRAHVATLKEQLAAAEGKTSEEADALREHNATLKADIEKLEAGLAEANARADKAIAALGALADQIAKLAEERARPWWRRLVG